MQVKALMHGPVLTCEPETNLAAVAKILFDHDCGAVPIVDHAGKASGMITDRDICMASATKGKGPSELSVSEASSAGLFTCGTEDDIKDALHTMGQHQVRRLPVVDSEGRLQGMLSINDCILRAEPDNPELSYDELMQCLKLICRHRETVSA